METRASCLLVGPVVVVELRMQPHSAPAAGRTEDQIFVQERS